MSAAAQQLMIPLWAPVSQHADGTMTIGRPLKPTAGEITTEQAAKLYGCSPQHILNLRNDVILGPILKWRPLSAKPGSKILWEPDSIAAAKDKAKQIE